ncbi:autophagy protein 13 [Ophidiomyces ophidiicola]|nr:autophagy protein 13 [Ophidiomyces ophidiicola]KAI1931079.1 autophagy protein 13 [Ophidiomyces ophidiicola]KAI2019140.1 autophagy protein 13 [Ophidiomyces ophidiicola]KAI2063452.1 autophagy protein 13 [Ophidiomyces ophidiicola]KAI2148933.1 autophagy protein 13 [Ophidiomyces ophidiicola]
MHQHRRTSSAVPSSGHPRQPQNRPPSQDAERFGPNISRGLAAERHMEASESDQNIESGEKPPQQKLNQMIQNFHTKAALIILHSRIELRPWIVNGVVRTNRWFNVGLDEADELRPALIPWKTSNCTTNRPPPMIIEIYLDLTQLTNNQSLVILDDKGKRWDVVEALAASGCLDNSEAFKQGLILERWRIELGPGPDDFPTDLGLPAVYKKSIVVFRSLYTYSKMLPAWKFFKRHAKVRPVPALLLKYRIIQGTEEQTRTSKDPLRVPLVPETDKVVESYSFGMTESPAGTFSAQVTYRSNCDFRVDDSEALLSSRFMGVDEGVFKPSLPSDDPYTTHGKGSGSLPVRRQMPGASDLGQMYGSMSTFHHPGLTRAASPITAVRTATERAAGSPRSPSSPTFSNSPRLTQARVAALSSEGNPQVPRRPSISVQPFKAPPLSASPALTDNHIGLHGKAPGTREAPINIPTTTNNMQRPGTPSRRSTNASETAMGSSTSGSPKPASISRFSSSFSHRRGRPSFGGTSRPNEDHSSDRVSISTSPAYPAMATFADTGATSSESVQADEDNISDFLKMLDLNKGLLSKREAGSSESNSKRTSTVLSRFRKMKESNTMLSESMSSSLILQQTAPLKQPSVSMPTSGAAISVSSSPGKAISPHTPHTPAVPSRLSANSVVDYSRHDRPSRQSSKTASERTMVAQTGSQRAESSANAIDIPQSPRPFPPTFRRPSSAAPRRSSSATEEDPADYSPFGMRSLSLGAEERSLMSLSELVQGATSGEPEPSSIPQNHSANVTNRSPAKETLKVENISGISRPYQPRFAHARNRGSFGHLQSHNSAASSLGRGSVASNTTDAEREGCSGSVSNSGTSIAPDTRRSLTHRFSMNRGTCIPPHFDEDEPLLFAMSDFGVSRRSLEEGKKGGPGANP